MSQVYFKNAITQKCLVTEQVVNDKLRQRREMPNDLPILCYCVIRLPLRRMSLDQANKQFGIKVARGPKLNTLE